MTGHYCRFPSYFTIGILSVLFSGASKGGARGARPRLFLAAALARRAQKKFFRPPPPLIWRSGSATALAVNIFVNLLSPSIHTPILKSDFLHFLDELVVRIFISEHFPAGDHFVEPINIFPWWRIERYCREKNRCWSKPWHLNSWKGSRVFNTPTYYHFLSYFLLFYIRWSLYKIGIIKTSSRFGLKSSMG